jgi:hypothetical protein
MIERGMESLQAVREVLRALADIRDGAFYRLWVDLTSVVTTPLPDIGFRIFRVADGADALAVVSVSMRRSDGVDVCWSLSVETSTDSLRITGSVELTTDDGVDEVFSKTRTSTDAQDAVETIHAFAREVCDEGSWAARTTS